MCNILTKKVQAIKVNKTNLNNWQRTQINNNQQDHEILNNKK